MDVSDLKSLLYSLACGQGSGATGTLTTGRVCCDSRSVRPGDIFVAVKGVHVDGHKFIPQAVERGAHVIVAEQPVNAGNAALVVKVADTSVALGELAQASLGVEAGEFIRLGVTGTKGKTTVAYLTQAMLKAGGMDCGLIGTILHDVGDEKLPANNTTPGAVELAVLMKRMLANGLKAVVMECSSHALHQRRTAGIAFSAAAFTNLAGDHLDYHVTQQAYLEAKTLLFADLDRDTIAILNAEDPASRQMAAVTQAKVWDFGIDAEAKIRGRITSMDLAGSSFELRLFGHRRKVNWPLLGRHNVSNALAAAGLAYAAGVGIDAIVDALSSFGGVPGRFEVIENAAGFTVLVDYAHTDDSLRCALETLRELKPRQVIVVFGCGGDRDRTKRPRMAAVAENLADRVFLTSDNPRNEAPCAIMDEIMTGFSPAGRAKVTEVVDRRLAIEQALNAARKGDVVLIAGKGHEDYQIVDGTKYPFDDRAIARAFLRGDQRQSSISREDGKALSVGKTSPRSIERQ
ncbi:MAG: UDP-N-acetylmuramoyl-L-alanyl-D-glutamate--2,6-diaminopimelate ligase [Sedimentisphaerales bacterium]|nr:UDP-N-acetylmuramoyl-L-alanyl-D-glutamate--2,6-diaminopimelate ligase [Sedimentisphaerales bacterium]